MTQDLTSLIIDKSQEEMEKQLFGGNIYASAHKFPSIYVTNKKIEEDNYYNKESFINYVTLINHVATICGGDIAKLFAEIYKVYNVNDDPIHQSPIDKMIISFCTEAMAHLSLAMNQSELLINHIEASVDQKSDYEIEGKDYCFIVIVLNNLFYYYTTIVNFMTQKKYLDNKLRLDISLRISMIMSGEFETLRLIFKVIECYKEAEPTKTFH